MHFKKPIFLVCVFSLFIVSFSLSNPSHITILEIYADTTAYQAHILTSHFKKYKETVKDMVKSLELVDDDLIAAAKLPNF